MITPLPARVTIDGNEAVARVAYRLNEVVAIYPITPASPMGEWADAWSAQGRPNLWGSLPSVVQLQSEAGAAGTLHGALQAGALGTSFTSSQGLLLMIPTLYKLAGELTPVVLHIAARALAAQALSIFGDHGDVMATRGTGCGILCATSVQQAGDFAAIATALSLRTRLPLLHVLDGFRTSHEIQAIEPLSDAVLQALMPTEAIRAHRERALSPEHPVVRGTSQNPDVYFQARESVNRFYAALPDQLLELLATFGRLTGRHYAPYAYSGPADARRVLVAMGSACDTIAETLEHLNRQGARVGLVTVQLFRPWVARLLVEALPPSTRAIAVLDRCKDPGASGEPLYLDVVSAIAEQWQVVYGCGNSPLPQVVGGRYGLGSKEFTPAMVKAVVDHLEPLLGANGQAQVLNHFSVGIDDDVTHQALPMDGAFVTEPALSDAPDEVRAIVYGLGSDGTVGANKAAIKIIGATTDRFVQGYFVYDSKKAGTVTVSHLRFGPRPLRSRYLIQRPTFVACHQWAFVDRFELLEGIEPGGTLLLNSPHGPEATWQHLPARMRQCIGQRQLQVWLIDAERVARQAGLGPHINTVMQSCFFALVGVLPREQALQQQRQAIHSSYGSKGEAVVAANLRALDASLDQLIALDWQRLDAADSAQPGLDEPQVGSLQQPLAEAPPFVQAVIAPMLARRGDALPVSALPCDGTWPLNTARYEKRSIAAEIPLWESDLCVQCGKCLLVCPHAAIRAKLATSEMLEDAPPGFRHAPAREPAFADQRFTIQVAPDDCTGCALCVAVCPAHDPEHSERLALNMAPQRPLRQQARGYWDFFLQLSEAPRDRLNLRKIGQQQLQQPLFEFSGACAGCGETPYLKLLSQLFGDRLLIANATGCSSIYGGNLPTTPWSTNAEGHGPAWSNSLFEDNAEFGFGMRVALDQRRQAALELLQRLAAQLGEAVLPAVIVDAVANAAAEQRSESAIAQQRQQLAVLRQRLLDWLALHPAAPCADPVQQLLAGLAALLRTSVWMVGGDGWAYDIGFGGLDHVIASGRDVNILVLDTEVYSNTGGQMSKATPLGAVAPFAAAGKATAKKDLGLMAMTYGDVYVASVAMGARDEHTIRCFLEAESYPGPSLILAYSHCIAHGIAMEQGMAHQRLAVEAGRWLLYRHDPRRLQQGLNPLQLDSRQPQRSLAEAMAAENRFAQLHRSQPRRAQALLEAAQHDLDRRLRLYRNLAVPWTP